jgi:hypothetical protein
LSPNRSRRNKLTQRSDKKEKAADKNISGEDREMQRYGEKVRECHL